MRLCKDRGAYFTRIRARQKVVGVIADLWVVGEAPSLLEKHHGSGEDVQLCPEGLLFFVGEK